MKELKELVDVSHAYSRDKIFFMAGGSNVSYKNNHFLWVKTSGTSMATLTEKEFVKLERIKLRAINNLLFSNKPVEGEEQVTSALLDAFVDQGKELRPSVETSLHECIDYAFVIEYMSLSLSISIFT
ncbi:MAG: hypothetical protein ACOC10_05310 [Bacteroidota bacterium]